MSRDDQRTHLGMVPGGLPEDPERADVAFIVDDVDGDRVRVYAMRVLVDPSSITGPKAEREVEVVASFWMPTEYFISTFGGVAADLRRRRSERPDG